MLCGCQQHSDDNAQEINTETTLARFSDNGTVTLGELQQYLLSLPINERWSEINPDDHYKRLLRKMAVRKQLLTEAKLIGADQEAVYLLKKRQMERAHFVRSFLSEQSIKNQPTQADLKRYYDEHIDQFTLPEKRNVYHIFKSNTTDDGVAVLENARQRIIGGESIKLLAQQLSESESRHKEGFIGLVSKGQYPADFDQVVFNLDGNVPSEVISTTNGHHVFYVSDILPEKRYGFVEVRQQMLKEVKHKFAVDLIKQSALTMGLPESFSMVDLEQMKMMLSKKDPQAILYQVGEQTLSLPEFQFTIKDWLGQAHTVKDLPEQMHLMLQQQAYSEVIYQHLLDTDFEPLQYHVLNNQLDDLLMDQFVMTKIKAYVNERPELLKGYYDKNALRFSSPIQLNLTVLKVPIVAGENLMPVLEASIEDLNGGALSLDDLATRYNGKIEYLGFKSASQLSVINKRLSQFVFQLETSQHSVPFTDGKHYSIAQLVAKRPAKLRPLSLVRELVLNAYIKDNKVSIFDEISAILLQTVSIDEQALARVIESTQALE